MKSQIVKMLALMLFGAATLSSCAIDNQGRRGRHYDRRYKDRNDRYHDRYRDRDHHYYNN